ncbi:hypothetical protein FACS1894164_12030 [Spirochaetia bacterium]|nr:hypothetical protein FACS1894164_12030 [Spirochaetia bacterium]
MNIKRTFVISALSAVIAAGAFLFISATNDDDVPGPDEQNFLAESTVVYVTKSGKKYHLDGCSSLSRSKIAMSLEDAVRSGYGPCANCHPPVLSLQLTPESKISAELYRVNRENVASSVRADLSKMVQAEVVHHVDGDTVKVTMVNPPPELKALETIRMLGVDTPETVHPTKDVEYFGIEASDFTKARLLGKRVYLAFDWDLRDSYGRLLCYIYTEDGDCFNKTVITNGYGHAYTRFSFRFRDEFRAAEQEARNHKRGLWG